MTHIHTVTTVTRSPCAFGDWVCFFDRHQELGSTLGPTITAVITIAVAASGWFWRSGQEQRGKRAFGEVALQAVQPALKVTNPLGEALDQGRQDDVGKTRRTVFESRAVDTLEMILRVKPIQWPSIQLYIAARALCDTMIYMRDLKEGEPPGFGLMEALQTEGKAVRDEASRLGLRWPR